MKIIPFRVEIRFNTFSEALSLCKDIILIYNLRNFFYVSVGNENIYFGKLKILTCLHEPTISKVVLI